MGFKFTGILLCCTVLLAVLASTCTPAPSTVEKAPVVVKPAAKQPIYIPTDADDAMHEAPASCEGAYEWWYMDASFDNGYSASTSWFIMDNITEKGGKPIQLIKFAIYDPAGKMTAVDAEFDANAVTASSKSCDVTMGSNRWKGTYPRYDINFRQGDLGCKLTFESVTEGFKSPPDGVTYFSKQPERYIGWVIAQPRAKVTGTLILNGKEIPVSGVGYHDHNWGNCPLNSMYNHWNWGRVYLPDYTFLYSVGEMTDALGRKPSSVIFTYKGSKLLDVSTSVYADASDFVTDNFTNAQYPRSLVIRSEGRVVTGTLTHKFRNLVEAWPPSGAKPGDGSAYFRFISDCDIKLNVAGDKIDVQTPLIHEYLIP